MGDGLPEGWPDERPMGHEEGRGCWRGGEPPFGAFDFLRGLLDAMFVEACVVGRDGRILLVNEAWRSFGVRNDADPERTGEGTNYLSICDSAVGQGSETAHRFAKGLRGVLGGRIQTFQLEYDCHANGIKRWFVGHVTPLRVAGEAYALVCHSNVTDRKLAEQSYEDALRRLRSVMDAVPDIVYELDLEGRLVGWNRALEDVTGYRAEELRGRQVQEFFAEEDRPAIAESIRQKLRGARSRVEGRLRTRDGRLLLYQWMGSVLTDAEGQERGLTGAGRDITAERQAQDQLRRSEALLAEAQSIAHLGSWEWMVVPNKIVWSEELFRIHGLERGQFTPTREGYTSLVHPDDRARIQRVVDRILEERGSFELEHRICRPDGSVRTLLLRARVLTGPGGAVERIVGTSQDITELKSLDHQIRLQYEELKELDRLKGAFVNSVTHELRTPLTSIMGYAEFLEDEIGGPLTADQHQFVRELQRGAKRLENLLNDLLDFARLEAGTFKLTIREADLAAKVHESLDSLRPQASEAKVALRAEISEEPLWVPMDQQRIGQVFINLIGNAIRFTPEGGAITVRACREGDDVRCEVLDTGIGIAEEDLPKLFRRFVQLDPGIRTGSGAGLGLSISKSIIDAHGGRIGVESALGQGSMFWFTLPLRPQMPRA